MTSARIDVLCCALTTVDAGLLDRYASLLSDGELQRLRSFRAPAGAKEFLVGRALLRTALAERLNCAPLELQFTKNTDGKPSLLHPVSEWQFNLSHSHDWVALALCEGGAIGVDIESYSRRNNLHAIAQRFFSDEENARLAQCADNEWLDYFFAVWTLKEAHAKALGCGLPKILACSSIAVNLTARTIDFKLSGAASTAHNVSSWWYRLDENSALALVAHGDSFSEPQISRCVPLQLVEPIALTAHAIGYTPPKY